MRLTVREDFLSVLVSSELPALLVNPDVANDLNLPLDLCLSLRTFSFNGSDSNGTVALISLSSTLYLNYSVANLEVLPDVVAATGVSLSLSHLALMLQGTLSWQYGANNGSVDQAVALFDCFMNFTFDINATADVVQLSFVNSSAFTLLAVNILDLPDNIQSYFQEGITQQFGSLLAARGDCFMNALVSGANSALKSVSWDFALPGNWSWAHLNLTLPQPIEYQDTALVVTLWGELHANGTLCAAQRTSNATLPAAGATASLELLVLDVLGQCALDALLTAQPWTQLLDSRLSMIATPVQDVFRLLPGVADIALNVSLAFGGAANSAFTLPLAAALQAQIMVSLQSTPPAALNFSLQLLSNSTRVSIAAPTLERNLLPSFASSINTTDFTQLSQQATSLLQKQAALSFVWPLNSKIAGTLQALSLQALDGYAQLTLTVQDKEN